MTDSPHEWRGRVFATDPTELQQGADGVKWVEGFARIGWSELGLKSARARWEKALSSKRRGMVCYSFLEFFPEGDPATERMLCYHRAISPRFARSTDYWPIRRHSLKIRLAKCIKSDTNQQMIDKIGTDCHDSG